jgi:outer membrane receptor protein involved in Fe transport
VGKKTLLSLLVSALFAITSFAQTGKISGKVLNAKNEPIPGVSVKVVGVTGGVTTDVEGQYSLSLPAGKKYEIDFSSVGYNLKPVSEIEVIAGQVTNLDIMLEVAGKNLSGVTVTGTRSNARRETVNSLIQFQKNTNTVAAVVSAESIRRSPDRNTSEVLKRVPGTSVQEGKYLVVRGLSDRYNFAMLNGIPLSSTEPDRKTFSFDIFPAAMIDNIIINKAFVPELPGEWAGGLVQVNTKDIPAAGFLSIQVGTGFNTQTIGHDFYTYQGGKTDWLGMDDGFRGIPSELPLKSTFAEADARTKTEFGKKFRNVWTSDKDNSLTGIMNKKFELSGGFNKALRGAKLGASFGLTYNQSVRRTSFGNRPSTVNDQGVVSKVFDYSNERYAKDILWGGLANVTLSLGNNHKISFKNLFNVNATNYVTERKGVDFNDANPAGQAIKATELALKSNTFFNTQLSGDHNLAAIKTKFHWYGSFNILDQYVPDQRRIQYNQEATLPGSPYLLLIGASKSSQTSGSRYYGFLSDYIYTAGGDVAKSFQLFGLNQSVKAGFLFQVKDRLFDSRPFAMYLPTDNAALRQLPADKVFAPENFGNGTDNKFAFNELSGYQYRYMANTILNAAFLQFDNQFTNNLRATWGVRVEDYDQVIGSLKQSDIRHLHSQVRDFLPGVNITYKLGANANLRLSGSQTVIRPEFRELSDFQFYDFDLGATLTGNRSLKRTKVTNADIRYEMYPRAGEVFTVGVFYKYFNSPIELFFNTSSGGASTYNYINADKANGYGIELEYRKKLDFSQALRNFTFQTNLSYIYNRVESNGASLDRPMQGQSPYVFNASLQYDIEQAGLYTTLLYNQIGDRIFYVGGGSGAGEQPPVWEATRPVIDFQVAKRIIKRKGELKLNISDILNRTANFYFDLNKDNNYDKGTDALIINRKYGTGINLAFTYNIK